jgi:hypothetical protein
VSKTDDGMIASLLRERQAYIQRELPDRVKQVEAELKRLGYEDKPAKKAAAPANRTAPEGRKSTAD